MVARRRYFSWNNLVGRREGFGRKRAEREAARLCCPVLVVNE